MNLSTRFDQALHYAVLIHAGQLRKGTEIPYLSHQRREGFEAEFVEDLSLELPKLDLPLD